MSPRRALPVRLVRLAAVFAIALAAVVVVASPPAPVQAGLVSASPEPGVGLRTAPGAVVPRFSEPLNLRLSAIAVLDSSGREVGASRSWVSRQATASARPSCGLSPKAAGRAATRH